MLSGITVFLYLPRVTCFPTETSQIYPIVMIMRSQLYDPLNTSDNFYIFFIISIVKIDGKYRYCCLLASKQTAVSVWQMPVAMCTVLNSW